MSEQPTVTPHRVDPNPSYPGYVLVRIICPHCGAEHTHSGAVDDYAGHRAAHCHRGRYVITGASR